MIKINEAEDTKNSIRELWKREGKSDTATGLSVRDNTLNRHGTLYKGKEYVMTPKEKTFAEAYVKNNCHMVKAITEAKVSKAFALSVLYEKKKHIITREYIRALQKTQEEVVAKELGYTAVESFKEFLKVQEMATKMKKIIVDSKSGKVSSVKDNPDLAAYLKAEEQKGKLFGLYKEAGDDAVKTIMNIVVGNAPTIGMQKIKTKQDAVDVEVIDG